MAVGRISGPLLAQNLFRDDVPLAFYNTASTDLPVLYLDVTNGYVGIKKDAPQYELDVAGTINADVLRVLQTIPGTGLGQIGLVQFSEGNIGTSVGPLTIVPAAGDNINLNSTVTATGITRVAAGIESTGTDTGSLLVEGGVGIQGNLFIGGITNIVNPTNAVSTDSGALQVAGGVGIGQDLYVGGFIYGQISTSSLTLLTNDSNRVLVDNSATSGLFYPMFASTSTGFVTPDTDLLFNYNRSVRRLSTINLTVGGTTASTSTTTGALVVTGGVAIGKNLIVAGDVAIGSTATATILTLDSQVAGSIVPTQQDTYTVGSATNNYAEGFFDTLYSNIIASQSGPININPADSLLQINGNIRVTGDKPIGTAPVVTNVLYVTMDGDDSNDGRAQDASRACRTIGGAINSPFYGPGTSIHVASGRYWENNPLVLQPYTSVIGTDLRTTAIEPINKTQDLFHVQSGCYIFGMQFLNGRSGVLPGTYALNYNRGAYCIAFPPQVGGNKIDTYHSPYVQNCTNQTGPWLFDGTMFQPNQTVQIPLASATGSWETNTNTITVNVTTGTISTGMSINAGPQNPGFFNARTLLLANKPFIQEQTVAYVNQTYPTFNYPKAKCFRDVGIILENIAYDSVFGGNEKSVEAGLAYYDGVVSVIAGQETQTVAAINYINTLSQQIILNSPCTNLLGSTATYAQVINTDNIGGSIISDSLTKNFDIITNIINNGPSAAPSIYKSSGPDTAFISAEILLQANRAFIQADTVAWINEQYPTFYTSATNVTKSYRDTGLVVDAVSQDIILGGNIKTIEAALSFWNGGYPQITNHKLICIGALNHAKAVALDIIQNNAVSPQVGNTATQVINTFFSGGVAAYQSVERNFYIITNVIDNGVTAVPQYYQGGGLFAATGLSGNDIRIVPKVQSVTDIGSGTYVVVMDQSTVGYGINSTLYFGNTTVFPELDSNVPDQWAQRRVDLNGGMGGMLVDGSVVSARSPVASMVLNAYTQVSQGGRGIHIINNGYAQLVSIFTIFCNIAVETDSGGIASITNSNSNFGLICLKSKGFGRREFSGTVYNPNSPAFITNGQYYPTGYFPQNGNTLIYVPDTANRPHIALVMEVEPPPGYINQYGYPGFVTAAPNMPTLTTGTLTITGIDTLDIAVGQSVFIRDQFGNQTYAEPGTVVVDVDFQSITLNKALINGGGDPTNSTFFTIYTCGNAYYTVLSSSVFNNPVPVGQSLIETTSSQTTAELGALNFVSTLTQNVISNIAVTPISTLTQTIIPTVSGGSGASSFVGNEFDIINGIIQNGVNSAPTATKLGTPPSGAGSAITLIKANIEFITQETVEYVKQQNPSLGFSTKKCARDVRLILQQIIYDLGTGGNYNAVYSGLSYFSRAGTYHLVNLGEAISNPALMPDGATVNFYQRSYMSASGYTFEYVGAGCNYGSLPQVGRADPIQSQEVVQINNGKVFFTSTDQNGDFRIGPGLVVSQATGVLSGRTFTKSLFATMTPFILAVEAG
jgi:hypothetical protein